MHPSIEFSFANFHFAMEKTKKLNNHKAIQLENRKDIKQKNNRKLAFQKTFFFRVWPSRLHIRLKDFDISLALAVANVLTNFQVHTIPNLYFEFEKYNLN